MKGSNMSEEQQQNASAESNEATSNLLDRAIEATLQTPEETTKELLSTLAAKSMEGTLK